jgi:hypothetical protein
MFTLPDYWLTRPDAPLDHSTRAAFDQLLTRALAQPDNPLLEYRLAAPKWQFLCYLAEHHGLALHGSGRDDINCFEPRQPVDLTTFGNQRAVYAAADGIWAMFFAIVDRDRYSMSVNNACVRVVEPATGAGEPHYVFSVGQAALCLQPWRTGVVYLLPRTTFVAEPAYQFGPVAIQTAQLASLVPVVPLARISVSPEDFPFLKQIRGHDDARLQEYATAMQTGAPWPDSIGPSSSRRSEPA